MRGFLTSTERSYCATVLLAILLIFLLCPAYVAWNISNTVGNLALRITELEQKHEIDRLMLKTLNVRMRQIADETKWIREQEPVSRTGLDRTRMMEVTAYTCHPSECSKYPGEPGYCTTTAGLRLLPQHNRKIVAADPRVFKAEQKLHIDGVGIVTVSDTGNEVKGMHLDLFWDETDRQGALKFGRQVRKVTIIN